MAEMATVEVLFRGIKLEQSALELIERGGFVHTGAPLPVGTRLLLVGPGGAFDATVESVVEPRRKSRQDDPASGMQVAFDTVAMEAAVGPAAQSAGEPAQNPVESPAVESPAVGAVGRDDDPLSTRISTDAFDEIGAELERIRAEGQAAEAAEAAQAIEGAVEFEESESYDGTDAPASGGLDAHRSFLDARSPVQLLPEEEEDQIPTRILSDPVQLVVAPDGELDETGESDEPDGDDETPKKRGRRRKRRKR